MNRSKNPSSPLDMTLLDLVEKYREATEIFNRYNEKAGECILCHSLFEPLKTVIEKYGLLYCFDVAAQFKTLHSLKKTAESVRMVVPSHATPRQDITSLVDVNLRHMEEIAEIIFSLTTVSRSSEEITKRLCDQRNIPLRSIWQYHLHLNTVKAYLSAHLKENRVSVFLEENTLIWVRK
jgi:hypothetical protein